MCEGFEMVPNSSYKISKSWECSVQPETIVNSTMFLSESC